MKKTVNSWKKPKKMASILGREDLEPSAGKDLRYLLRVLGAHILNVFVWLTDTMTMPLLRPYCPLIFAQQPYELRRAYYGHRVARLIPYGIDRGF